MIASARSHGVPSRKRPERDHRRQPRAHARWTVTFAGIGRRPHWPPSHHATGDARLWGLVPRACTAARRRSPARTRLDPQTCSRHPRNDRPHPKPTRRQNCRWARATIPRNRAPEVRSARRGW